MLRARNYQFGNQLLLVRTRVGLTQIALAAQLGVHRRSVQNWETGVSYPKTETLRRLIAVFLEYGAFTPDNERAEAQALWDQATQDSPYTPIAFDDVWFARTMADRSRSSTPTASAPNPSAEAQLLTDWGEAPAIPMLVGREQELEALQRWIEGDRCRLITIVGIGGIGKTSLAIAAAQQLRSEFAVVLFRSLHNAPPLADVLDHAIRAVSGQQAPPGDVPNKIALLVQLFREQRCLLILDNLDAIMQPGTLAGTYRAGYADYGDLIQHLSEREHRSCLLVTSREKPAELGPMEGGSAPVRTLLLTGLDDRACGSILESKDVVGTAPEISELARRYGGNPLAMLLVAAPVREVFGGKLGAFLEAGDTFANGVGMLMARQCARSTPLERAIMFWLAIERELVPLSVVLADLGDAVPHGEVLAALESLRRRTQIERGPDGASFTLQPVIREFVTEQVIKALHQEIVDQRPAVLVSHVLVQATARDYIRRSQERLMAMPLLERLMGILGGADAVEQRLLDMLASWRDQSLTGQGYGPGNLVNLLRVMREHLRGLDLSRLAIRQAYLQDVELQDTRLSGALVTDSVFTGTFDIVTSLTVSREGTWAAGSRSGEVLLWTDGGRTLHQAWQAHTDRVQALAFSPDGRTLASSGSWDGTLKLWDITSGRLLWTGRHPSYTNCVAFAADGHVLASSGNDATVRLWNAHTGTQLQTLLHPVEIAAITWSSAGRLLASGDTAGNIRVWRVGETEPAECVQTLVGHAASVEGLAFAPDNSTLASASWDSTIKLWAVADGQVRQTLAGHTQPAVSIAWSPDGRILASGGRDRIIRLWDTVQREYRAVLYAHLREVNGVAFTPDSRRLLSSSEDGTLRVWDVASGQCLRVMEGYAAALCDVAWSPDGVDLVAGGSDTLVTIFDVTGETHPRMLRGHGGVVMGVGWSPDGRCLASSEWNNAIRLWDPASGACLQQLRHPDDSGAFFDGLAWSPVGLRVAAGTYCHGVLLWELAPAQQRPTQLSAPTWIRHLAWSPDGRYLAGGGADGTVYVWDAASTALLCRLVGHHSTITGVSWRPDGAQLASASSGQAGAELFVWDMPSGERRQSVVGDPTMIYAVAWGINSTVVVGGGLDGRVRWWDVRTGARVRERAGHEGTIQALRRSPDGRKVVSCGDDGTMVVWDVDSGAQLQVLRRDRPYERLEITGLTGITGAQRSSLLALGAVERSGDRNTSRGDRVPFGAAGLHPPTSQAVANGTRRVVRGLPFQPTPCIGRDAELAALARMLDDQACRLITVLGPGGIGKTRLAIEVATTHGDAFADGAAFVALASVGAPNQIVSAIGETLNLSFTGHPDPTAYLLSYLHERQMLLVLDSFEHVLAGADMVSDILTHAPRVTVVVTSRERLYLRAEWLFAVDGLAYPAEDARSAHVQPSMSELAAFSAIQLFAQRVRQVQSGWTLSDTAVASIAQICQQVEGMPLAIELAAANVRTAPLAEIERQIRANLDVLTTTRRDAPARHRSLRAVFEHSWNLLNEPERLLVRRLAVFRGGWTVAAATEVAGATLAALTTLLDKSLVRQHLAEPESVVDPEGATTSLADAVPELRFVMPKPIREYAWEQLMAHGDTEELQRRHAGYFLAFAEAAMEQWDAPSAPATLTQLDRELDNVRAALQWTRDGGDRTLGLQLAGALRKFWRRRGLISEGRGWLEALLAGDDDVPSVTAMTARLRAVEGAAWLASDQHAYTRATQLFHQSTELRRVLGMIEDETNLVINAAIEARTAGQYGRATDVLDDVITQQRALRNRGSLSSAGLGLSLYLAGLVRREQGDFERAGERFRACIALHREIGDREGVAVGVLGLSDIARDQGAAVETRSYGAQSLVMLRALGVQWAIGFALNNLAWAAVGEDDLPRAVSLVRESISLFRTQRADGSLAEVLVTYGQILLAQRDSAGAYAALTEALQLARVVGPRLLVAAAIESLGSLVAQAGHAVLAVRLLGAAAALRLLMGTPVRPVERPALERTMKALRSTLGVPAFMAMWEAAATLPLEQILTQLPDAATFGSVARR